ncbi:class I SAM-dependent methyltransferase [Chloroflexota bacterium]
MFQELEKINKRPKPFEFYTASELWTDEHTSEQMLTYHLNENIDVASRKAKFIDRSINWMVSRFGVSNETKIADFGCGPGLIASRLARQGNKVTGIDFFKRSFQYAVEEAKKSDLTICYANQNYLEYETEERFDLILMIM